MTDTTTEPVVEPTRQARWPWVVAGLATAAVIGGTVIATAGGANADDKALCHTAATLPGVSHDQLGLAIAASILRAAMAEHPGASELVRVGATNMAVFFEDYSKPNRYRQPFVDGQPTADTLRGLAFVFRNMGEVCGE